MLVVAPKPGYVVRTPKSRWNLYVERTSTDQDVAARIILKIPYDIIIENAIKFGFPMSGNETEYDALI